MQRSQIGIHLTRLNKEIPIGMVLPDRMDSATTPNVLRNCISAAGQLKEELSSMQEVTAKVTYAFVTRFLSDINHFNEKYTQSI